MKNDSFYELSFFALIGHFSSAPVCACGERKFFLAIDQPGYAPTDQHTHHNVDHGVLLQEHGGDTDQESGHIEEKAPAFVLEQFRILCGVEDRHGAHDVQGGADVGVGVCAVKGCHHVSEQVIPGEDIRP